ncbi:acyltransferase [Polaribacter sp.]|uniref:acyltransferase n=1 Tax=Polaribacter sp. TaxID=1920175 RepID=UPI003EFA619A
MAKSVGSGLKVNGKSLVNNKTFLGNNVNFNGMMFNGKGKVVIGNNFHSGKNCQIITSIHNFDKGTAIPYDNTYILKETFIGNNVWFGNNVIILGGVTIGEGAIIQAGSVVVNNIPKYSIAGGHPAKVFSQRDINHYDKLNEIGQYH